MNPFIRGIVLVWLLAFSSLTWAAESSTCGTDWQSVVPNHDLDDNNVVWADELQLWVAVGGVINANYGLEIG